MNNKDYAEYNEAIKWVTERKDQIIEHAKNEVGEAVNLISVHRMLVKQTDKPTIGIFLGCLDSYKKIL